MHELSIAQGIIKTIQEQSHKNNIQKVLRVSICIGKLSGVVPEALYRCLSVCVKDTPLESVCFDIHLIPAIAQCKNCLTYFDLVAHEFVCPSCKESDWNIISGRELFIKELEVV